MRLLLLLLALLSAQPAMAEPDEAMRASLQAFFARGVHWQQAQAELIRVERWPDASGRLRWHLPRMHGHPGRLALIAEQGTGRQIRRWYVPVRVHWWAKVVVAATPLSARSLLTRDMMKQTRADIAGHHGKVWRQTEPLLGMRMLRPLDKGQIILGSHVRRPPLIRRGDPVDIVLDAGSIHIRTAGTALRTAARGERILVRNSRSREVIAAIAESRNTVRVAFTGSRG